MIKKLLLTLFFAVLVTIASSGTTYAAQEGEVVISEELGKLNDLYKEGIITEEEFSKAKSILLNPDLDKSQIKKKKKKLTAAERKELKEAEQDELRALMEQLREEKKAERERIEAEKNKITEERKRVCLDDPQSKSCKKANQRLTNILDTIKKLPKNILAKEKKERQEAKQATKERRERIKKERELEKQARLKEQEIIKAERKARNAERNKRKAEWNKACSEDPESKACLEGKPSEKIKNVLKKIGKQ